MIRKFSYAVQSQNLFFKIVKKLSKELISAKRSTLSKTFQLPLKTLWRQKLENYTLPKNIHNLNFRKPLVTIKKLKKTLSYLILFSDGYFEDLSFFDLMFVRSLFSSTTPARFLSLWIMLLYSAARFFQKRLNITVARCRQ